MSSTTMSPTLLSLAPELVCAIAERVNQRERRRLRLTCKHLGEVLESQVLHTIYFSVGRNNSKDIISTLQSLATTKNFLRGLSRSSRHLIIGSLSSKPFKYNRVRDQSPDSMGEDDQEDPIMGTMRTYLLDALDVLRSLQSVTWRPEENDEAWTHEIIMDFLATRPALQVFKVKPEHLQLPVPLYRMQGLREIAFTEEYGYRSLKAVRNQTYNNFAKLLAICPAGQITKLSVVFTSLHQIFEFLTHKGEPLRLNDLRMTQSFIKLDAFIIPHLRHLTCLHLLSMKNPSNSRNDDSDTSEDTNSECSGDLENAEHPIGSKMSDFWSVLQLAGIYLKEIRVDDINAGLLGYLTHYAGLIKLDINIISNSFESKVSAGLFFAQPLTSHVGTLEELVIGTRFDGPWRIGEHNISAISRCTRLKKLSVCVSEVDLPKACSSSGNSEVEMAQNQPNIVKELLDMVSVHMPQLSQLSILPSSQCDEPFGGPKQTLMRRQAVARTVIKCILTYPIPPSIVQWPRVKVWWSTLELRGGDQGWRYKKIKDDEDEDTDDE